MWTSMLRIGLVVVAGVVLFGREVRAADWHHLHLTATDSKVGAEWYAKHMEGKYEKNGAFDMAVFGKTSVLFFKGGKGFPGSVGSAVDHVGFSFSDLDAKMKQLEGEGVKILAPARAFGKIKFAFVEDPWGTKIEVMEDPDLYGFHHIHLHTAEPRATLKWYADAFGGEVTKYMRTSYATPANPVWMVCACLMIRAPTSLVRRARLVKTGSASRSWVTRSPVKHFTWQTVAATATARTPRADSAPAWSELFATPSSTR